VSFDNHIEAFAFSVANTIVENAPEVFLFIALALLARQGMVDSVTPASVEDATLSGDPLPD
jgi:hypothetical protein